MSYFQTTRDVSIHSEVPPGISRASLVDALHDHSLMMHLSPIVTGFEKTEVEDKSILAAEPAFKQLPWYRVEESIPVVGKISFLASHRDHPDGVDSVVYAPAGLIMHVGFRVLPAFDQDDRFMLQEDNHLQGNRMLMPFILWNFEKVHREMQQKLFEHLLKQ